MDNVDEASFQPHLEALRATVAAGFRFRHLPDANNDLFALHGCRVGGEVVDHFVARDVADAFAARYRLEDHGNRNPPLLWHQRGTVADVVTALLALPSKGQPNASRTANRASGYVWLPPPS